MHLNGTVAKQMFEHLTNRRKNIQHHFLPLNEDRVSLDRTHKAGPWTAATPPSSKTLPLCTKGKFAFNDARSLAHGAILFSLYLSVCSPPFGAAINTKNDTLPAAKAYHQLDASMNWSHQMENGREFLSRGRFPEAEHAYSLALQLAAGLGDDHPLYSESLRALGELNFKLGKHTQAKAYFKHELTILNRLSTTYPDQIHDLFRLAQIELAQKDTTGADRFLVQALQLSKRSASTNASRLELLYLLANCRTHQHNYQSAAQLYEEARATAQADKDELQFCRASINLAMVYTNLGKQAEAKRICESQLDYLVKHATRPKEWYARCLEILADCCTQTDNHAQALVTLEQIRKDKDVQAIIGEETYATYLRLLAREYQLANRSLDAIRVMKEQMQLHIESSQLIALLCNMAQSEAQAGHLQSALVIIKDAMTRHMQQPRQKPDQGCKQAIIEALQTIAQAFRKKNDIRTTMALYHDLLQYRLEPLQLAKANATLAELSIAAGNSEQAEEYYHQALAALDKAGPSECKATILQSYAHLLVTEKKLMQAFAILLSEKQLRDSHPNLRNSTYVMNLRYLTNTALELGHFEEAEQYGKLAVVACQQICANDQKSLASADFELANVYAHNRKFDRAIFFYVAARSEFENVGDKQRSAECTKRINNMGPYH